MPHLQSSSLVILCLGLASVAASQQSPLSRGLSKERVLSRHRRFLVPASSGWSVTFKVTLTIPLQDVGSSVSIAVPFTYSFDDGT